MEKLDLDFFEKLSSKKNEYDELENLLNSVEIMTDNKLFLHTQKKLKKLEPLIKKLNEFDEVQKELKDNNELLNLEKDLTVLNELNSANKDLLSRQQVLIKELKQEYLNLDGSLTELVSVELRLKSGEQECLLDVYNMFLKFAESIDAKIQVKEDTENAKTFLLEGENIFKNLSIFSGNCKIIKLGKESIVGIVVLSENSEKFSLNLDDVIVETHKSGGAGGQHINKTESAIRLIHKPTGIVATCQDERSQTKNKERAFENLKSKLEKEFVKKQQKNIDFQRKNAKNALFSSTPVLCLNFDKNEVTYFKIKKSYNLKQIICGELDLISNDVVINDK